MSRKKIGVILSGCGYLDGSEIREAVGVLWALSLHDIEVRCYAPEEEQMDVFNHFTGKESIRASRNVLEESARLARGKIEPLSELDPFELDGLILPGGFGAAKNLSDFSKHGAGGSVNDNLFQILQELHTQQKPIGAVCIAPAILALCFKDESLTMTLGEASDASKAIEKLGHIHVEARPNEIIIDDEHSIVTTPAYMYDNAPLNEVFEGIKKLVDEVVRRALGTHVAVAESLEIDF